jgi:hypothetical protein
MQLAGLDGPLAELIPPCTDPARLDASQDRRFRHADSFRRLPEGVTHVLLSLRHASEIAPHRPIISSLPEGRKHWTDGIVSGFTLASSSPLKNEFL